MADTLRRNNELNARARQDARDKVSGEGPFAGEIVLPGMLEARLLRSPHAHARIVFIDTSAAGAMDGVRLVATGRDLELLKRTTYGNWVHDQPVICTDRVRFEGDVVAAVVAVDEATAVRALAMIHVSYQLLPPVMDIQAALRPDAPALFDQTHPNVPMKLGRNTRTANEPAKNVLFTYDFEDGDIDAIEATAAHVFTDRFHFSRIGHFYMEPWICIARQLTDGVELRSWRSTNGS